MSAEETKHQANSGSCLSENGRTNLGFGDPLRTGDHGSISDPNSHGRNQPTDWPKCAHDMMEDFLTRCPGTHSRDDLVSSRGQATAEQCDPSVKVLILYN